MVQAGLSDVSGLYTHSKSTVKILPLKYTKCRPSLYNLKRLKSSCEIIPVELITAVYCSGSAAVAFVVHSHLMIRVIARFESASV